MLDSQTGKLLREQSLIRNVDYRQWDPARQQVHRPSARESARDDASSRRATRLAPGEVIRVMPAWHCNIVVAGYHYFLTTTAHRRNNDAAEGQGRPFALHRARERRNRQGGVPGSARHRDPQARHARPESLRRRRAHQNRRHPRATTSRPKTARAPMAGRSPRSGAAPSPWATTSTSPPCWASPMW